MFENEIDKIYKNHIFILFIQILVLGIDDYFYYNKFYTVKQLSNNLDMFITNQNLKKK